MTTDHLRTPPATRRRQPKGPSTFAVVVGVVLTFPVLATMALGIGASMQLWTSPGSSLGWELFFPVVTASTITAAGWLWLRQRNHGWSPTACFFTVQGTVLAGGALLAYAFTLAPN